MTYSAPLRDMQFVLENVVGLERLAALPGVDTADGELVGQILDEGGKLANEVLAPLNSFGDKTGVKIENGVFGCVATSAGFVASLS